MKIETKFDVGQKVWVVTLNDDSPKTYREPMSVIIREIETIVCNPPVITYWVDFNRLDKKLVKYSEKEIFTTQKECEAKCKELNEGE